MDGGESEPLYRTPEPELTEPVPECLFDGSLNPAAVGWSRRPLHRCNLRGAWGRKKRWDYWCVMAEGRLLAVLYADFDYLGLVNVTFLDWSQGPLHCLEKTAVVPLALGFRQPETVGGGDIAFGWPGLHIQVCEEPAGTRLLVRLRKLGGRRLDADVLVRRPEGHETLSVLVPWSTRRFQFTSKHNTRPAEGWVEVGGCRHELGAHNQAFGCLDFGRGLWPYRTEWNWASAAGVQAGRTVGLQLGGLWTDGTGLTENGLCVDGRLSKLGEAVHFDYDRSDFLRPWRIGTSGSDRVALGFTPFHVKPLRVRLLLGGAELHVAFGSFDGHVVTDQGERIVLERLLGWAEEMRAHW